jgi:hypothetical protein
VATQPTECSSADVQLHDALHAIGDGLLAAVAALDGDEDAVALRLGVAQVDEGEARLGR